jgi:hypothetical protein
MTALELDDDSSTDEELFDGDEEVIRRLERRIRAALAYRARSTTANHYWIDYPFEFWDRHLDDLVTDGLSLGIARGSGLRPLESLLHDAFQVAAPMIFGYVQLAGRLNDRANVDWRPLSARTQPKIGALVQLHARSLVLLEEIALLAFSGYPSGATTISRTLQEVRITAKFLYRYESRISERYLASHIVEMWRNKEDYVPRGSAGRSKRWKAVETELDSRYAEVIRKFGPSMAIPNGWAWPRLEGRYGNSNKLPRYIQLSQLRAAAGARFDRERYRRSSHQVHGGRIGAIQTLTFNEPDVAMLGPRPSNLARPLLDALYDVQEVSACLLKACDNFIGNPSIRYWLEALDQLSHVSRGMVTNAQGSLDEYFE